MKTILAFVLIFVLGLATVTAVNAVGMETATTMVEVVVFDFYLPFVIRPVDILQK